MPKNKEKVEQILKKTAKIVNPVIEKLLISYVAKKHWRLTKYQVSTGGKRLRPALVTICAKLLGGKIKDILYPAAGLEILHNYTLIIDDIIDNSLSRRDKSTVWAKFGRSIAECIAINYAAAIFQAANRAKEPVKISEIFARTGKTIVDGEILDILFEQVGREEDPYVVKNRYQTITEKDYLEMVSKKTAALFQACCEIGGICANATPKQITFLKNYGFNLGIAFQISDDLLDIFGEEKKFGKKIGKDIEERKGGNIVIYFASQEFSLKEEKEFWQIIRKKRITKKDINKAINLIKKTGAKERAFNYGKRFVEKAKSNLRDLPKNKWNNLLAEITSLIMRREK